jgi:hypothetical protein
MLEIAYSGPESFVKGLGVVCGYAASNSTNTFANPLEFLYANL